MCNNLLCYQHILYDLKQISDMNVTILSPKDPLLDLGVREKNYQLGYIIEDSRSSKFLIFFNISHNFFIQCLKLFIVPSQLLNKRINML